LGGRPPHQPTGKTRQRVDRKEHNHKVTGAAALDFDHFRTMPEEDNRERPVVIREALEEG
jgi:hypothetical protein